MRPSNPTLFALSTLVCSGSSLPFFRAEIAWLEHLLPRATYSVVPVDGGSTIAISKPTTIIETIIQTATPATKTVIETDEITLHITATQVISGSETTETLIVTTTAIPSTSIITTTAYSVINVKPTSISTTTTTASALPTSSTSSTTSQSSSESVSTSSTISVSTTSSISYTTVLSTSAILVPASTSIASSNPASTTETESTSYTSSFTPTLITSTVTPSASSISTTTYDDGQWHTTYPPWTNGTASLTLPPIPARTASPMYIDNEFSHASSLVTRALAFASNKLRELGVF